MQRGDRWMVGENEFDTENDAPANSDLALTTDDGADDNVAAVDVADDEFVPDVPLAQDDAPDEVGDRAGARVEAEFSDMPDDSEFVADITNDPRPAIVADALTTEPMSANEVANQLRDPPELPGPTEVPAGLPPMALPVVPNKFTLPRGASSFSRSELAAALGDSRAAAEALDNTRATRSPEVRKSAEQFYRSLSKLAERATYVDRRDSEEVVESTRELLQSLRFDQMKQRMMANATRNWIQKSLGVGVAATANVERIEQKNDLFYVAAKLAGKVGTPITIVTRVDPANDAAARFAQGDRIIFLGTIVERPDGKIDGYRGFDQQVVWMTDLITVVP